MNEEKSEQAFIAWVNKEKRIVTFREIEGFEKLTYRTQDDKMAHVYHLCQSGYRIL